MYTPIRDLPTVPFPDKVEEFIYNSYEYELGEKVHLFENIKRRSFKDLEIMTIHGFIICDKSLTICQRAYFANMCREDGFRYLGIGIVHKVT